MSRVARKKSSSGIYHIVLRGINRQQIFEDSEDCEKFLQVLSDCKAVSGFELYAYCLMSNHIHILLKEVSEPVEQIFKRIGGRFVYWYNTKYRRVGHLFQDRFKSEPIETDEYFLTVIRYIHQNPVKAGLCKKVSQFQYIIYNDYISKKDIIDYDFTFGIVSLQEFVNFNNKASSDLCLEITENNIVRKTDEQAKRIIEKYSKCRNVAEFQTLDTKTRDFCLKKFKESGLSIRQISRLTGVSFNVVRKF